MTLNFGSLGLAFLLTATIQTEGEDRDPPDKPAEPFRVFVHTEPRGDPDVVKRIHRATSELEKRIARNDDRFELVRDVEEAEIVVKVETLWDSLLQAKVSVLGSTTLLRGLGRAPSKRLQERRAASSLAQKLENECRDHYWELLERRRLLADLSRTGSLLAAGREWILTELARRLDRPEIGFQSARWRDAVLEVSTVNGDFHLEIDATRVSECLLDLECQRGLVARIVHAVVKKSVSVALSKRREARTIAEAATDAVEGMVLEPMTEEHRSWLEEEVAYIITDEERELFLSLELTEERSRAIEAFWDRRDPDRVTPRNEFRDEHYRRLDVANRRLGGRKTDRGRFYIILGEPVRIERFAGRDDVVDSEVWIYEGDPNLGLPPRFSLVFFKEHNVGDYELYNPMRDGPEALLHSGFLRRGDVGSAVRVLQRVSVNLARASLTVDDTEAVDIVGALRPSPTTDLVLSSVADAGKSRVDTDYLEGYRRYGDRVDAEFSFKYVSNRSYTTAFYTQAGTPFVHYGIELEPQDVTFRRSDDGESYDTILDVSFEVRDMAGNVVATQQNQAHLELTAEELEAARRSPVAYQENFPIAPGVYKLGALMRNLATGHYTVLEKNLVVNAVSRDVPILGGVALAYDTELVEESPSTHKTFQLGELSLQPAGDARFARGSNLEAVAQVLGATIDHRLRVAVIGSGSVLQEHLLPVHGDSPSVVVQPLSLEALDPGSYMVVFDLIEPSGAFLTSKSSALEITSDDASPRPALVYRHSFPSDARGLTSLTLANQYLVQDRVDEAEAELRRAVALNNPELPEARWKLARLLLRRREADEALELLLPLRDDYAHQMEVVEGLGFAFYLQGDCARALEYLERAKRRHPADPALLNAIDNCYQRLEPPPE